uniref:Uncharacterized protein n=1 Tax=Arundo donax TaxID=35708 RepID=A0A0A8Y8E4_ARUDO
MVAAVVTLFVAATACFL